MFLIIVLTIASAVSADVYTDSSVFERLCHFKNDGVVNHLNSVDNAMIADGSCRMIRGENGLDGFALWHDPTTTGTIIDALKEALPETSKPSHFVLTAHEVLADLCPDGAAVNPDEEYHCRGSGHDVSVMAGAMHNWQRALCAQENDPEWQGEYDPAYQPQQVALTAGFMCILACDCNNSHLPAESLAAFAESADVTSALQKFVCTVVPWESVDFTEAADDVDTLADLSAPLMEVCGCSA